MAGPTLHEKLEQLPAEPGAYLFKDAAGDVVYVGKASSLRARVRSYFQRSADLSPRTRSLVDQIRDLDFIVVSSEREALALELNLIQKHRPRFNVRYRDDKSYPYIRIDLRERFPMLCIVRQHAVANDGARYFGPYTSSRAMWETIRLARRLFGIPQKVVASAKKRAGCVWTPGGPERQRPCLDYYTKRCLGPCAGMVSEEEYRRAVCQVCDFLEGRGEVVLGQLREEMEEASKGLQFERAARIRNRIAALEQTVRAQKVISPRGEDMDVLGHALREDTGCVTVLQVRDGRLVSQDAHYVEGVSGVPDAEVLNQFAKRHYQRAGSIPARVLLPCAIEDANAIEELLSERLGKRVRLLAPKRGEKKKLVEMAVENAAHQLRAMLERESAERRRGEEAILDLQKALALPLPPRRIEAFDISNIQGKLAVGSMIVFEGGHPKRSEYRRFRIRSGGGEPDDYGMMEELLSRRLQAAVSGNVKFERLPDLLLVDGGAGQLGVAVRAMGELGLHLPAAGLAKENELVYLPDKKEPAALPAHSRALHLLQRVRDEAHRFAVSYHRRLRARETRASVLDSVRGIGEQRKRKLLARFRTLSRLQEASADEIAAAAGCGLRVAEAVVERLRGAQGPD
jgi:excinuclease ABC subunit C